MDFVHPDLSEDEVAAGWTWQNVPKEKVDSYWCSSPKMIRTSQDCYNIFGKPLLVRGMVSILYCGVLNTITLGTGDNDD